MKQFRWSTPARAEWVELPDFEPITVAGTAPAPHPVSARHAPQGESPRHADETGHIRSPALSFANMHEYGDLLIRYLHARKSVFIDRLNWRVSEADNMEFDQYDTPFCRWVILHEFGEVIGGVRLMPTTARCGIYSYMLRDAQLGILEDLPSDVLFFRAPVDATVWEASRFFIVDSVPAARRTAVQHVLFRRMRETAAGNGARFLLGIVPAVWARWARRLDATAIPIGAKFSIDGTWSQSVMFNVQGAAPAPAPAPVQGA
jgi:N-acyl-L-homoserine lactone synthetase